MQPASEDVVAVAREALRAAEGVVPSYAHVRSPRTYDQHQLFALLAVRRYLGTDLRTLSDLVRASPALREALGLRASPHYSTLGYASRRLLAVEAHEELLRAVVEGARARAGRGVAAVQHDPRPLEYGAGSNCPHPSGFPA